MTFIQKNLSAYARIPATGGVGQGSAAGIGNLDRQGDVLVPGCFRSALPDFIKLGAVTLGHNWMGLEIGMPIRAEERGNRLEVEWAYHETPAAQEARAVAMARLKAGKSVGLSIGFSIHPEGAAVYSSGAALLRHFRSAGVNMALIDEEEIAAHESECRAIFRIHELYEFAQVTVPANPQAAADSIKTILGGDGSRAALPLSQHLEAALAAVEGAAARLADVQAKRQEDGRTVSTKRMDQARELRLRLDRLLAAADVPEAKDLRVRTLRLRTRQTGGG